MSATVTLATAQAQSARRQELQGQIEDLIIDGAAPDAPEVVALTKALDAIDAAPIFSLGQGVYMQCEVA